MISFPKIIQIETAIVCNGHCVFCPHKDMQRGPVYMENWVWKKIVDETRGRGILYRPFMINEPFADLRMPEIIAYITQDETAKVEFNSNGNFPREVDIQAIIQAGVHLVRFSIDGFTEETFKKSGRGGKFDKIVDNILRFIKERDRQNSRCIIEVRMIDLEINKHEQQDFLNFWNKQADKAIVTPLYDWPWTGQTEPFRAPCPKIRTDMFFMTDGRAVLCCWDAFARAVVGDIKENTVEEIWLGELNQKYRAYLAKGEREEIVLCSRCDAYKGYDFSSWEGY